MDIQYDQHSPSRSQLLPPAPSYRERSTCVDWSGIYDSSRYALSHRPELRLAPADALRQLRTIYMGGGRQNGKTHWAVGELTDPGTIIVAKDKQMRQAINRMYCLQNLNRPFTVTIPAQCPDPYVLVEELLQEYHTAVRSNVFTLMDLESILTTDPSKLNWVKRVIIDDATHNCKLREVYLALAKLNYPDMIVVALG
jgi:hypothetical protein